MKLSILKCMNYFQSVHIEQIANNYFAVICVDFLHYGKVTFYVNANFTILEKDLNEWSNKQDFGLLIEYYN